jgi:hypothetical protein
MLEDTRAGGGDLEKISRGRARAAEEERAAEGGHKRNDGSGR